MLNPIGEDKAKVAPRLNILYHGTSLRFVLHSTLDDDSLSIEFLLQKGSQKVVQLPELLLTISIIQTEHVGRDDTPND